ncbi:hypothetical protein GCM10009831_29910 [Dietzia cercidiphylli]|uniref:Uncharacterized protein n=1 Tax=Dietzia cercidiphylli TaxID=498199 RepID=A0ABN2J4K9_9ACTN
MRGGVAPLVDGPVDHCLETENLVAIRERDAVDTRPQDELGHPAPGTVLVEHRLLDHGHLENRVIGRTVDFGDEVVTVARGRTIYCIGHEGTPDWNGGATPTIEVGKDLIAPVGQRVTGCDGSVTHATPVAPVLDEEIPAKLRELLV